MRESVWTREDWFGDGPAGESGAGKATRPALTRTRIVEAAIAIADAEGLSAVSMRRVAAELSAGAMSLYRHVAHRDELIELMYDSVQGEMDLPAEPTGDWRIDLATAARADRAVSLRHPWCAGLFVGRPIFGPNTLRRIEFGLAACAGLGLSMDRQAGMAQVVGAYVRGFVQAELGELASYRSSGQTEREWQASMAPYLERVRASGRYPNVVRFAVESADPDPTETFETGLRQVLDGLAVELARGSAE